MTTKEFQERSDLRIFLSYFKPHKKLFVLDMVCALTIALIDLAFPYLSRWCMYELLPQNAYRTFFTVMAVAAAAFAVRGVLTYIIGYYGHTFGILVEADIRRDLFRHMQELDFGYYDRNRTGALMSRLTSELFEITELAHHGPEDIFISGVTVIGALVIMFTIQWRLALLVFALVPLILLFTASRRLKMNRASRQVKERTAGINADIESSISGVRVARAFHNEAYEIEKFEKGNARYRTAKRDYYREMGIFISGLDFLSSIMNVAVIAFGGFLIMRGDLDYIDLITFSLYVGTFLQPIRRLSSFVEQYTVGMAGFSRFRELMAVEPDITDAHNDGSVQARDGSVIFDNVSFKYDAGGEENTLDHINLTIRSGETIGIIGGTGSAKTTLVQLIPRLYDVTEGRLIVGGHDVRDYKLEDLRQAVSMVLQKNVLFSGTIRDNLKWGDQNATDQEIIAACKAAQAYDFVMSFPDGFDTDLGQGGVNVSGGQKQRLCIARALLKKPKIIILDDSTSAVDTATDAKIRQAFSDSFKDTTAIIIAQRITSICDADRIVVLDDGKIAGIGTHEELLQNNEIYRDVYHSQQKGVA